MRASPFASGWANDDNAGMRDGPTSTRTDAQQRAGGGWTTALLIAAATVALYTLASVPTTLFDRDEPRFAQATIEMIASGNWLYPTFGGELRPDKPILIYWLMSLPARAFDHAEWAMRLPSAVGIGIAALATFVAGRRLMSTRAATLAMLVFITAPLTAMIGTAATADGWLIGMTTAAIAAFITAATSERRAVRLANLIALAIFCGLAQLTKGPVGLAVVGFPVIGTLVFARRHMAHMRSFALLAATALLVSVAIFLAWAIPANAATHGEFAERGIGKHVISRALSPMEGHGGDFLLSLPYYVPVLIAGFFPWAGLLPSVLWGKKDRTANTSGPPGATSGMHGDDERTLTPDLSLGENGAECADDSLRRVVLVSWALPTFVMMSLVATKLPHYVLPIWPALALAVAHRLEAPRAISRRMRIAAAVIVFSCAVIGTAGFIAAPWIVDLKRMLLPAVLAGVVLLAGAGLFARLLLRQAHWSAALVMAASMLVTQQILAWGMLREFEAVKLPPRVAGVLRNAVPDDIDASVLAVRFGEPSLLFYLWPRRVTVTGAIEAVQSWKAERGPAVLIIPEDALKEAGGIGADGGTRFTRLGEVRGFNYSSGDWLTLVVMGRDLPANSGIPAQTITR